MRIPLSGLRQGMLLKNRVALTPQVIQHLKYRSECGHVGGGFLPNSRFVVAEVSANYPDPWVRLATPGSNPTQYLKLSGDEIAHRFDLV